MNTHFIIHNTVTKVKLLQVITHVANAIHNIANKETF